MPALNWYLTNNSVSVGSDLSETDPGAEAYRSAVTGWIVSIIAAGNYSSYFNDVERAAATFGATAQPDGSLDTSNGDFWTSPTALTGSFAATDWTIYAAVRAQTRASGQDGRVRARIFRGVNQDGTGATEITSAATDGTTVTDLLTTVTQVSTVTVNPGAFSVSNEYIFIQLAWEITGDATFATADVNFRIGNGSSAGSRVITSEFTAGTAGGSVAPKLSTGIPEKQSKVVPYESNAGYKLLITDHTGTISDDPARWPPELKAAVAKCCCEKTTSSSMISKALYPSPCCTAKTASDPLSGRILQTTNHNTELVFHYNPAFSIGLGGTQGTLPPQIPVSAIYQGNIGPLQGAAFPPAWWSDFYEMTSGHVEGSGIWRIPPPNQFPWMPPLFVPYTVSFNWTTYFYLIYGLPHVVTDPSQGRCSLRLIQATYPVGQFTYFPESEPTVLFYLQGQQFFNPEPITYRHQYGPPGALYATTIRGMNHLYGSQRVDAVSQMYWPFSQGCFNNDVNQCDGTGNKFFFPPPAIIANSGILIRPTAHSFSQTGAPFVFATSGEYEVGIDCGPPPQPLSQRPRVVVDAG